MSTPMTTTFTANAHHLPLEFGFKEALWAAIHCAQLGVCSKSKRGAAIWMDGKIIGCGSNGPPEDFACDGSTECREHCNKLCVHAEAAAMIDSRIQDLEGFHLLHIKLARTTLEPGMRADRSMLLKPMEWKDVVDSGIVAASGPPSCWQCSRAIHAAGITAVWLFHESGWKRYWSDEFHELTLRHCGLPVIRRGNVLAGRL